MSSLRNAVKRVTHKERSQPVSRRHLGILEKKKDYKQRAIDYHKKEDRINALKKTVAMRNPDEFYFGMHNSQVEGGKHKSTAEEDSKELSPEIIALMKDQDLSYVRMKKQSDAKKAERLQASLHLCDGGADGEQMGKKRKHTIFVATSEEAENFDVAEHFDTLPQFAGRSFNRLRKQDLEKLAKTRTSTKDDSDDGYEPTRRELQIQSAKERKLAKKLAKGRNASYKEMEARIKRAQVMQKAEDHLVTEKMVAGKGRKRKIKAAEGGKPAQYKWRRKRLG
jgi:U3 small nucleolar RNA-associated protein 11